MADDLRKVAIRRHWAELLGATAAGTHPLYEELAAEAAHDDRLVTPLLAAPESQQRPNLLLAAVHRLVLEDPSSPLAPWYPTTTWLTRVGLDGATLEPPESAPLPEGGGAAFLAFLAEHLEDVGSLVSSRSTQTNEVGRAALLAWGLSQIRTLHDEPVALIDLGCSAGLNLLVDRIHLTIGTSELGDRESGVHVVTELRGHAPRLELPRVSWRRGLDRAPLSAALDGDALWLLACQWPDDLERFERTRRALAAARAEPPVLEQGDVVDGLRGVVDHAPLEARVVLFHSWVAAYLSAPDQARLRAAIRALASERAVSWLWLEHPRDVPGLEPPLVEDRIPGSSLLVLDEPPGQTRVLAQCHPHGSWLAPQPGPSARGSEGDVTL